MMLRTLILGRLLSLRPPPSEPPAPPLDFERLALSGAVTINPNTPILSKRTR
jgi:hypothetical protein